MSQEQPSDRRLSAEQERLSGTLVGGLRDMSAALGGLSTAFAAVGVVGIVLGLIIRIFISDQDLYSNIILAVSGGLLATSMVISYRTVGRAMMGRRGKYGTNAAIMVAAFLGIAVVVSFLAFDNSARMDVTSTKQFSLAPRTKELLKQLEVPVEAKVFFVPGRNQQENEAIGAFRGQVEDLLREFKFRSGKFSYEFIDPIVEPLVAGEYGARRYPTIVFDSVDTDKRHQVLLTNSMQEYFNTGRLPVEQDFVTGLLIVTEQQQKRVFFLTGHGERDLTEEDQDTTGFGFALRGILSENYAVATINLNLAADKSLLLTGNGVEAGDAQQKKVDMLIVADPRTDLLEEESQVIDAYLKKGGNMLLLLEPDTPDSFREFLARWGLVISDGHILDTQRSAGQNNEITVLARGQYFGELPEPLDGIFGITDLTAGLDTTYFPGIAALSPMEDGVAFFPPDLQDGEPVEEEDRATTTIFASALGFTSTESWLLDEPTRNRPRAGDPRGPFYPAVAVKAVAPLDGELPSSPEDFNLASLIVVGDSDFATNRYFFASSNSDFFLNSINWLVGDIALADIRPKPLAFRQLVVTRNEYDFMRYSSWFLLPVLMAVAGGLVWWRRR